MSSKPPSPDPKRRTAIGRLEVVLSGAGYGFIGIFGKQAYAAGLTPGVFLTLRFTIASTALWIFMLVARRRDVVITRGQLLSCAALGVGGYALFTTLYFRALQGLSASLTSLVLYTFPVMVTVAARVIFKEPVDWKRWVALPIVCVGLVMLLWGNMTVTSWGSVAYALGSAVLYSAYVLASSRLLRGLDSLVAGLYIMTAAAISLAVVELPSAAQVASLGPSAWTAVLGIATISTLGPLILFLRGLQKLSNSEASLLSLVEPMTAVVAASALLGERLTAIQLSGGALILGALVLSSISRRQPKDIHS